MVLGVCAGLVAAAALLAPFASTRDGLRLGGIPIPSTCGFRNLTGLPCPGCGLTRSWVDLARGDLASSLGHHRLGAVLMLYVLAQALRHGGWLLLPRARRPLERAGGWLDWGLVGLAAALLVNWAFTLASL